MLVDDEILVRKAIGKKLEWNQLGFELVGDCENGKDAIEFVKEHPVDVVLTDICMPHIDGMGLSKWLYENCPQTTIIIFSGYRRFPPKLLPYPVTVILSTRSRRSSTK